MILWLTGNSGAGKTTLAKKLCNQNDIILDGDDMRDSVSRGLGLSGEDREENNIRIARLAAALESQGFSVIVSTICPTEKLRAKVKEITGCKFIYLPFKGDTEISDRPYERPLNPDIILPERAIDKNAVKSLLRADTAFNGG